MVHVDQGRTPVDHLATLDRDVVHAEELVDDLLLLAPLLFFPGEPLDAGGIVLPGAALLLLFGALFLLAILVSFIGPYDNHELRLTGETWSQLSLEDALNNWWNDVPKCSR